MYILGKIITERKKNIATEDEEITQHKEPEPKNSLPIHLPLSIDLSTPDQVQERRENKKQKNTKK